MRRAQDDAIWIWLATSVDLKLEAGCFDEKSLFNRYIGFGTSQSICVGKSCFVHLIEIRSLATSFPRQKRIYYDIRVGVESAASTVAKGWSLETWVPLATIVSDNRADPLPYLVLSAAEPSKKNPLNAFFSSCRKVPIISLSE